MAHELKHFPLRHPTTSHPLGESRHNPTVYRRDVIRKQGLTMFKFLGSVVGIIFLVGLLVIIGILALIF